MFKSQSKIRVISLFMVDNSSDIIPSRTLWLHDDVSVGNHESFITDVFPGDLVIWQCPENSGISFVTGINGYNPDLFIGTPQHVTGHENTYIVTITMDPGKDILNELSPYSIVIDYNGQQLQFDPKIRVIPSPTSNTNNVSSEKNSLPLTNA